MSANVVERVGRTRRWWLVAGVALVVAAGAGGWLLSRIMAARTIRRTARVAVAGRDFALARPTLERWLAADPNSGEAHYLLARVELAEDHGQEALNAMGRAFHLGYPPDEIAPYHAVALAKAHKFAEAEPVLVQALAKTDAPMPEVAEALARIYLATFRLPQATSPLARWMRDEPDDPTPYLLQNEVESRSNADRSVVVANFREALRRDPKLAKARFGLADALRQAHHLEEAAEEFAAYVEANPDDPEGHLGAGRVALERGRFDEAAKAFDRVLALNSADAMALKERGAIELRQGRTDAARKFLTRATEADPFDPDAHYNLMLVHQRTGDAEGVARERDLSNTLRDDHARINSLKDRLVKAPRDLDLRRDIAEWLLSHGHEAEGVEMAEQALRDHPGHEPTIRLMIDHFARKGDAGKVNYYRMLR